MCKGKDRGRGQCSKVRHPMSKESNIGCLRFCFYVISNLGHRMSNKIGVPTSDFVLEKLRTPALTARVLRYCTRFLDEASNQPAVTRSASDDLLARLHQIPVSEDEGHPDSGCLFTLRGNGGIEFETALCAEAHGLPCARHLTMPRFVLIEEAVADLHRCLLAPTLQCSRRIMECHLGRPTEELSERCRQHPPLHIDNRKPRVIDNRCISSHG